MYKTTTHKHENELKAATMFHQTNENATKRLGTTLGTVLVASLFAWQPAHASEDTTGFVDSVHDWGTWELGLAPAAGGPVTPKTGAIKVNRRNLQFRPNDNAAFRSGDALMLTSGSGPTPAPVPLTPPTSAPLDGPPPTGGPADRFR